MCVSCGQRDTAGAHRQAMRCSFRADVDADDDDVDVDVDIDGRTLRRQRRMNAVVGAIMSTSGVAFSRA